LDRVVAHVDMDAFYASIEIRDNPSLRGRPVVVGAPPNARGVVAAASYDARRFGVRSAMPSREAGARCPNAVFLPVNMEKYRAVSAELFDLLGTFTPQIEPLSIDEAFLDLTGCPVPIDAPTEEEDIPAARSDPGLAIARAIRARIHTVLGLPVSLGVAPNKFLAKLASELAKPDGLRRVYPDDVLSTLDPLPVTALWGVGEDTRQRLARLGVHTVGALRRTPTSVLRASVGFAAEHLAQLSRGLDDRPVLTTQDAKSVGRESTFEHDTAAREALERVLAELAEDVARRLRADGVLARTVTLKVRYADFRTITRAATLPWPTDAGSDLRDALVRLWERLQPLEQPVRLLGVSASRLSRTAMKQLTLFGSSEQRERIDRVVDAINARFGDGTVRQARLADPGDGD
jgi:DNA polymerase-4